MKDFKILKFLDKFEVIFKKLGADYPVLRKILQLKLVLDERRVPTIMMNNKKNEDKSSFKSSLFLYGFMGLFIAVILIAPFPMFLKMNIVLGMIIFMIMTTMVSDFSGVLLDIRDKNILLPRPIDSKTLNIAKIIHVMIYLFSITMAISGPALIAGLFRYGLVFFCIFLLELILICGFVIFFTSILYFFILKVFDGERLKDMINYFQIVLSIFIIIAYQLMGRIFDIAQLNISFSPAWWHYLIPATWFAAPFNLLVEHNYSQYFIILSILAVIIPVITLIFYVKWVIPYFEKSLQKLNNNSVSIRNRSVELKEKRLRAISSLICHNKTEKSFYHFTQNMISNERKLKLKLYPNLAFAAIIPFIFLFNSVRGGKSIAQIISDISASKFYMGLYITGVLLATSVLFISMSEKYKGAWIYKALPVEKPVFILKGAIKGYVLKFVVPVYFFMSLVFTAIYGFKVIPDIFLIFLNMLLLILFVFMISKKELPFYKDFQYTQDGGNTIAVMLLLFLVCGFCAVIHLLSNFIPFGVTINIFLSLVMVFVLWHFSFRFTWKDIKKGAY